MTILDRIEVLSALCKATGRYGIYLSFPSGADDDGPTWSEVRKAAPYLDADDFQTWTDGGCIILCDTADECDRLYDQTVGDDGPTEVNPYDGPARVYALTCGPDGELGTENT